MSNTNKFKRDEYCEYLTSIGVTKDDQVRTEYNRRKKAVVTKGNCWSSERKLNRNEKVLLLNEDFIALEKNEFIVGV